ncbi:uncharacterized protein LOC118455408 [Neolamprologus brichardi]|uniref:uncharacterized protein LOC118455408 n=1 Tax=Neolamprologus brichardi TaxID=32507 RepID=UPI001643AE7A|nr:uncharacterized protein LOC118455408 [Neolamprologus brichardi]
MICYSSAFLNFFQCKCFQKLLEQLRTAPVLLTYFVKSHVKDLNSVHLCSGPIYKYLILNIIFQIKCSEGADERSRCFSTEVLPLNQSNMFFPALDSQSGEKFPSILQLCVLQEGLGPQFEGHTGRCSLSGSLRDSTDDERPIKRRIPTARQQSPSGRSGREAERGERPSSDDSAYLDSELSEADLMYQDKPGSGESDSDHSFNSALSEHESLASVVIHRPDRAHNLQDPPQPSASLWAPGP